MMRKMLLAAITLGVLLVFCGCRPKAAHPVYSYDELTDGVLYLDYSVGDGGWAEFHKDKQQGWMIEFRNLTVFEEFSEENYGATVYRPWADRIQFTAIVAYGPTFFCEIDMETWEITYSQIVLDTDQERDETYMDTSDERLLEIGWEFWEMVLEAEQRYEELSDAA